MQEKEEDGIEVVTNQVGELEIRCTGKCLVFGKANPFFVDETKLGSGIYQTHSPSLYLEDTTLESFIELAVKYTGVGETWIKNARQCQMVAATSITTLDV